MVVSNFNLALKKPATCFKWFRKMDRSFFWSPSPSAYLGLSSIWLRTLEKMNETMSSSEKNPFKRSPAARRSFFSSSPALQAGSRAPAVEPGELQQAGAQLGGLDVPGGGIGGEEEGRRGVVSAGLTQASPKGPTPE